MSYRYLGNKTRIADWIVGVVRSVVPPASVIADPMCGTATMSAAFARAGYKVVAGDELRFPVLHAQARLLPGSREQFAALGVTYQQALEELNRLTPKRGFFWQEYSDEGSPSNGTKSRAYFTGPNAARIDAIRAQIKAWRAGGLDGFAADLLLHDLILATNRVANIAGTYGYYRSKWSPASLANLSLMETPDEDLGGGHRIVRGKAAETIAEITADAVYLDPPYTKRQYGGNYHIPETLALEDEPDTIGEGGLRPWKEQASDFCYGRKTGKAFEAILDKCGASWVFISYSEDAHLSEDQLLALCKKYGRVERHEKSLVRYRSNARVAREGAVREHLYVLEMGNAGKSESGRTLDKKTQSVRTLQY